MSKRLKYAKLRLAKPINADDPPPIVVPTETDVCIENTEVDKTSKYFDNGVEKPCTNEETFILVHSEDSDEDNEMVKQQSSRRRTQKSPIAFPNDGPKLPKLRKKACEGNRLISNFLSSQTNHNGEEDDDFEECRSGTGSQLKQTKVQRVTKKTTKAPKRIKNQSDIRKVFKKYKSDQEVLHELLKEHSASEQIDPEQLQIALAMSRSLVDQECSQKPTTSGESLDKVCSAANCSGSSEERRIVSIRTTLEQFGFRCKNSYTDYDMNVIFGSAATKNVKKIKHKRPTNLQPRNKNDLAAFIDSQAKKLIPLGTVERTTAAGTLPEMGSIHSLLSNHFWIAQTELSSNQLMEKYYVPELLKANPAPVGCMLKDWCKIPGRERTPDRNNDAPKGDILALMNSPDLFNDSEIISNATECDTIEQSLLIEIDAENKKQESGMEIEQKVYSQEVLVMNSSNDSGYFKLNEASRAVKESSDFVYSNNKEQVVEKNETTSRDMDQIPVRENSSGLQGAVVVFNDNSEEDKGSLVTVSDISHCPQLAFHQSSENIFDDVDPNPMVSFEVYSSEEEKIPASSQVLVGRISSNSDIGIEDMVQEDTVQGIILKQNDGNGLSNEKETIIASKAVKNGNDSCVMEARFSVAKDLSFNRLAIKARLSEALEENARTVAMVDLIENSHNFDKTISNPLELNVNDSMRAKCRHTNNTQDDVLYMCMSVEEDPDMTITYYISESDEQSRENVTTLPFKSECQPSAEEESEILTSYTNGNDNEPVTAEINCAENTFAYLDHLVKEFNLPPLKSQQNAQNDNVNQHVSIKTSVTDEIELESRKTEFCQNASDVRQHESKMLDEFSNHLQIYEVPKFDDHEKKAEILATQSPLIDSILSARIGTTSSKVLSKIKSCIQFDSPRVCSALKRTASETEFPSSSIPNEKKSSNQSSYSRFENKFNELKTVTVDMSAAEYVIRTSNVLQKPPAYEDMSTSEIERELFKYGLKALQRSKAVRMLHYLYEVMHPYVMLIERRNKPMEQEKCHYKMKVIREKHKQILTTHRPAGLKTPRRCAFKLDLNSTLFFLPSKPRKKMAWCAVPLHISFFNLVLESECLQRQILRYEPIDLDEINGLLKDAGLRYETNDLIAFFDKHCITFRTAASNGVRMAKVKSKEDNK